MPRISRKAGLMALAFLTLTLGGATAARADTVFVVGNANGALTTATVNCTVTGPVGGTRTLTFTITNTTPGTGQTARITGVGFDLVAGDFTANNSAGLNGFAASNAGGATNGTGLGFAFSDAALGNVPQFNDAVLDFGFVTSSNGNFSGGGSDPGIAVGQSVTFSVTGNFGNLSEDVICDAIFVRFQSIVCPPGNTQCQTSDVGRPGDGVIPEPTTMLLLGTGLAGIAAKVRRRRKATQVD